MTDIRPDTHYIPKAQVINQAIERAPGLVMGVIISKALRNEIRATSGWLRVQAVVDPTFQPSQFEVITNGLVWKKRTAGLKEADLKPYSAFEIAITRFAIGVAIASTLALAIWSYFFFVS